MGASTAPGCSTSCGGSTPTWSGGHAGNTTNGCATASAARWNCWPGPHCGLPGCSRTGGSAHVLTAGQWEPDESRGSSPVLREPGGEIPPGSRRTGLEPLDSSGSHCPAVRTRAEPPVREQPGRPQCGPGQQFHRAALAVAQPFVVFPACPPDHVVVEPPQEVEQPGAVEAPIIVDPPLHDAVEHQRKVAERLVTALG